MYQMEKNTAEKPVVTQVAKTWKSRVNAAIRHVRSRFGSSRPELPLIWPADSDRLNCASVTSLERISRIHRRDPVEGESIVNFIKQSLSLFLSCCLVLATAPGGLAAQADQSPAQPPVQAAQQTPAQLQQLVAPIALYPDALVAQILAAATYPDQIVEADRWLQQHTDLKGEATRQRSR